MSDRLPALLFLLTGCAPAAVDELDLPIDVLTLDRAWVRHPHGDLTVRAAELPSLRATLRWRGEALPTVEHRLINGTLWVETRCGAAVCQIDLDLALPDLTDLELDVHDGAVDVSGMSGAMNLTVEAGDATLTDLAGPCHAQTLAGDLTLAGLSGTISAHAEGALTGTGLALQVAVFTATGRTLSLDYTTAPSLLEVHTARTDIELTVPAGDYELLTELGAGTLAVEGVRDTANAASLLVLTTERGDLTVTGR